VAVNSTFDIQINYSGDSQYLGAFQAAADRWEQIITADIPDINSGTYGFVDDLLIDASVVAIDGSGGILAQAGPDWVRSASYLPFHGIMQFDSADVAVMFSNGTFAAVILHEMGHVLGIGTLWDAGPNNLLDPVNHRYTGANALAEYRILTGNPSATYIPVEDGGGPGTANGHWDEETFNTEIMTGYIESAGTSMPISRMTIASLADLGYSVNLSVADPYSMPGGSNPPPPPPPPPPPSTDDVVVGTDGGADTLRGYGGNDSLYGLGGDDLLQGDDGDDLIEAGAGNDRLEGGNGNDHLVGGPGADALFGGAGTDIANYLSSAAVTVDLIAGTANDGSVDTLNGIETVYGSQFADTMRGDNSANKFDGSNGADLLEGRGGDDQLEGGGDSDRLIGGPGADRLFGQSGIDTVDYTPNDGNTGVVVDLRSGVASGGAGNDTLSGIENVRGSSYSDTLHGNDDANLIQAYAGSDTVNGYGGNDRLEGGDGNDTITGGPSNDLVFGLADNDKFVWNAGDGNDTVEGGTGTDTLDFNGSGVAEIFGIAVNGVRVQVTRNVDSVVMDLDDVEIIDIDAGANDDIITFASLAGTDVTRVVVALGAGNDQLNAGSTATAVTASGQDGNDTMTGGSGNDGLAGDGGNDTLNGGAGTDQLQGGDGDDRLNGGAGADALTGGAGMDTADYLSETGVTADLAAGTATTASGIDTLSTIERVIGSQFADTLRGNSGNNILDGASGIDIIEGFAGNDRLEGGGDNDRLFGGDGVDELIGQGGNDLVDGGTGDDLVRGGDGDDSVEGRDGNDRLEGEAGADTIDAGAGNDIVLGGDGNDRIFAAGGTDTLTGGAGNDLFYYTNPGSGQMQGDTITDFQSVAGPNTGDALAIRTGFSSIAFNNGSTTITYSGVSETVFHPGVTLSLANDIQII
jgi:Ca2+-binding RTX toxin-like protein